MIKFRRVRPITNPFKTEEPKPKQPPAPKAVDPQRLCPFCQGPTEASKSHLEGVTLLGCHACKKVGIKGCAQSDWIEQATRLQETGSSLSPRK